MGLGCRRRDEEGYCVGEGQRDTERGRGRGILHRIEVERGER